MQRGPLVRTALVVAVFAIFGWLIWFSAPEVLV
jgi:hypothetical protein